MICDHTDCRNEPARAPRVVVPSRTPFVRGHGALRMMTTLHFCELHRDEFKACDVLTPAIKRDFEALGRANRPLAFRCDFERAWVELVLITTPEYRTWVAKLDLPRLVGAA